jgi:hypothetical protein
MNIKNIVLGGLVVLLALLLGFFASKSFVPAPAPAGNVLQPSGPTHYQTESFTQGLITTEAQFNNGPVEGYRLLPIAAGSNQTCWRNTSGGTILVDKGFFGFQSGTASSTFAGNVFATTSASVPSSNSYIALAPSVANTIIKGTIIATSSTATSTTSVLPAAVVVANGSYVCAYMQQNTTYTSVECTNAGLCETATSTNRGFNPFGAFHYIHI